MWFVCKVTLCNAYCIAQNASAAFNSASIPSSVAASRMGVVFFPKKRWALQKQVLKPVQNQSNFQQELFK